ncbi:polysaccharide deacetylase [Caballeronia fortuita]|uniref:Polysaccharide deacetylase n=1 Tax=Caballeronia fortuita TaxID=1777138 RepID=A0A158CTP8_9BURK|nr:polysaccharide deacetylase [Caballeronia fortuita]
MITLTRMRGHIFIAFAIDLDMWPSAVSRACGDDSLSRRLSELSDLEQAMQALLDLFQRYAIRTTWFICDRVTKMLPLQDIVVRGHEIGVRGPTQTDSSRVEGLRPGERLDELISVITRLCGRAPLGYTAPLVGAWQFSSADIENRGLSYELTAAYRGHACGCIRIGRGWYLVDEKAGQPWRREVERDHSSLTKIPTNWFIEELPLELYFRHFPGHQGAPSLRDAETAWRAQLDFLRRDSFASNITIRIHPFAARQTSTLLLLEKWIEYALLGDGARFITCEQLARSC